SEPGSRLRQRPAARTHAQPWRRPASAVHARRSRPKILSTQLLCADIVSGVPLMNTKPSNPEITAANFPALRAFLRGYFHEDVADEYGTPVDAADQFCEDADSDERKAVASEWSRLMAAMQGQPLPEINKALTGKLGGAVRLNEEQMQQVSEIFARCLETRNHHRKVANH